MSGLTRAFSYLIAAHVQAITLIFCAWWVGEWLNKEYPMGMSWYVVTFPIAVVAIAHSFYVIVRSAIAGQKKNDESDRGETQN